MARYVATTPIYFGSALAFAAGAQVPEDHVQRFGYDTAGWVVQVPDDFRGDAPELVAAQTVNNPPPPETDRWADSAETAAVLRAQQEFVTANRAVRDVSTVENDTAPPAVEPVELAADEEEAAPVAARSGPADVPRVVEPKPSKTAVPATGDTTTSPVTEA